MSYNHSLRPATPADLTAVMRSDDQMESVNENLNQLRVLRKFVDGEEAKWLGLKNALGLFEPSPEQKDEVGTPITAVPTPSERPYVPPPGESSENGKTATRFTIPVHRRRVLVSLMQQDPQRLWRTSELATAVQQHEPEAGNMGNLISRALTVLENEGLVVRVKKGTVRWSGASGQISGFPGAGTPGGASFEER